MTSCQKTQHVIIDKQGEVGRLSYDTFYHPNYTLAAYLTLVHEYERYYRAKVPPNKTKVTTWSHYTV